MNCDVLYCRVGGMNTYSGTAACMMSGGCGMGVGGECNCDVLYCRVGGMNTYSGTAACMEG